MRELATRKGGFMTSKYPEYLLKIVRAVARLSEIYWHKDCFKKEFKFAENGWLPALIQFTSSYSYERQGAPLAYRRLSRNSLENVAKGMKEPSKSFPEDVWAEFKRLAKEGGIGTNENVNPLTCSENNRQISSAQFVLNLKEYEYNILMWAEDHIREGKAEDATDDLLGIRGVGWKIAAFYLRDVAHHVAHHYDLEEEPAWCFQPVDVWIRRIATSWGSIIGRSVEENYDVAAQVFIDLAKAASVEKAGDLNAGAWVLGSQLIHDDIDKVVTNWDAFTECMKQNCQWNTAVTGILRKITVDQG